VLRTNVHFAWRDSQPIRRVNAGVCLHGHTMYSQECLSFLPRHLRQVPGISRIIDGYERGPKAVDFAKAYWTPPLSPASALLLEATQITGIGLRPLVSLTDHDNIEAGMSLQVTADPHQVPVSVEWTVPYERSILHLGIHNLPLAFARAWISEMAAYTDSPRERLLPGVLRELAGIPEVLIVLNHPFWFEEGVEEANHRVALDRALRECIQWLHAFELNGTRCWKENARVMELAQAHSRPLVSGGDRHASEPSACLNLTNAGTFSEFVSEVRAGHSLVWFQSHYREPMPIRVLEAASDILRLYPEYPGRERWTDRFFYRGEDGVSRPLSAVWRNRVPWMLTAAGEFLQFSARTRLRPALRLFLAERGEILFP
jgi:hypothetical protein